MATCPIHLHPDPCGGCADDQLAAERAVRTGALVRALATAVTRCVALPPALHDALRGVAVGGDMAPSALGDLLAWVAELGTHRPAPWRQVIEKAHAFDRLCRREGVDDMDFDLREGAIESRLDDFSGHIGGVESAGRWLADRRRGYPVSVFLPDSDGPDAGAARALRWVCDEWPALMRAELIDDDDQPRPDFGLVAAYGAGAHAVVDALTPMLRTAAPSVLTWPADVGGVRFEVRLEVAGDGEVSLETVGDGEVSLETDEATAEVGR